MKSKKSKNKNKIKIKSNYEETLGQKGNEILNNKRKRNNSYKKDISKTETKSKIKEDNLFNNGNEISKLKMIHFSKSIVTDAMIT